MNRSLRASVAGMLLALAGCQSPGEPSSVFPAFGPDPEAGTLGSLQPAPLADRPSEEEAAPEPEARAVPLEETRAVPLEEVIRGYQSVLPLLDDPDSSAQVRRWLADLQFLQAERLMAEQAIDELGGAINAYEAFLRDHPDHPDNDRVYYQLARAHDLRGDPAAYRAALDQLVQGFPDSDLWLEAQFRRGEVLFSNDRFAEAEQAFDAVTRASGETPGQQTFITSARYMKGWSQFKQGFHEEALRSYFGVLDVLLADSQKTESIDERYRTMVEDIFRVMGLSFSYLDGADSVAELFRQAGSRPWEILVYDRYSDLLLDREQYTDAILVYERYIDIHPLSQWAPRYHINIITTLQKAGFVADIPGRKAGFVRDYGLYSEYWARAPEAGRNYVRQQLEELLPELANRHYVKAGQASQRRSAEPEYRLAADYYREFVETFPDHPRTPGLMFLLAETRLELEEWEAAIRAFQRAAYDFGDHNQAAEAAYASVLAYRSYARTWTGLAPETLDAYRDQQQQNRLRFVQGFATDSRAVDVLFAATRYDYERQAYAEVKTRARQLIAWQPQPPRELMVEARLLLAHSLYALADYASAERAYQDALVLLMPEDERYQGVVENLAASVYRQAEARLAEGDQRGAVAEFLRVGQVAPLASLRASAEYDAAVTLIELADWDQAIGVMKAFRQNFPRHESTRTLPAKMALAYRETGQWELAADELKTLYAQAETEDEKRETLLIAAELYDRAENTGKAIDTYRSYANRYPRPLDAYMEAANRLAELYQQTGDALKRRFWLARQMQAVDRSPDQADDRMQYLAAEAAAVLARDALQQYNRVGLTLPLQQSMKAKVKTLETAVKAYQKAASYGVSLIATEAGFRIADIYARLGGDLMDADRPEGLSELEQMQYDLLLEEQAFPFEEKAIDIHEQNASRSWDGVYDEWVKKSFDELKEFMPARYDKPEMTVEVVHALD